MCSILVTLAAMAMLAQVVAAQPLPCGYTVTVLPPVDCGLWQSSGSAVAINNFGEVLVIGACGDFDRTYLWTGGTALQILPIPPGTLGFRASDLNDNGLIVGTAQTGPTGGTQRGYIYNRNSGEWIEIPPLPGGTWSQARGVNNRGQVCGWRGLIEPKQVPQSAFVWERGVFTDMGLVNGNSTHAIDLNEHGVVTGGMVVDGVQHPFLWDANNRTLTDLGSIHGFATSPSAINNNGKVVGQDVLKGELLAHGFLWSNDRLTELLPLAGHVSCGILDISNSGLCVGFSRSLPPPGGEQRGTLWWAGNAIDLNHRVEHPRSCTVRRLVRLSDSGQILGIALVDGEIESVVLHPNAVYGDTDGNCLIDVDDLIAVILGWGSTSSHADVNGDGIVNVEDLIIVIENWTVQ